MHGSLGIEAILGFYPDLPLVSLMAGVIRSGFFGLVSVVGVFYFAVRGARTLPDIPLAASNGVFQTLVAVLVMEIAYQLLVFSIGK